MTDNDNKRKLYDALSNEYDLGTFEQFASDVEDDGKRQKLYDAIKEEYDLPDFDGFTNQLVGVRSQPAIGAEQSPQRNVEKRVPRDTYQQATNGMPVYEPGASVQTTVRKPMKGGLEGLRYQTTARLANKAPQQEVTPSEKHAAPYLEQIKTLTEDLDDAYAERERLNQEIARRAREIDEANQPTFAQRLAMNEGAVDPTMEARSNDPELSMLYAAQGSNEKRIKLLERDRDNPNYFQTVGKGVVNPDTWFGGFMDLKSLLTLSSYSGEKLEGAAGEAQEAMLRNKLLENEAQQRYGSNDTRGQRWGDITAQAIPFVAEFLLTGGGYGFINGGEKAGAKLAAKAGANKLGTVLLKGTGMVADDITRATLMANTTGVGKTASDILERHMGELTQDENGEYVFKGGKSLGRSVYEGEVANTLEYLTELAGTHLDVLGKAGGEVIGKGLEKMGAGRVNNMFMRMSQSQWNKLLGKGGLNDYPSEVLEEELNIVLNSLLVGDNKFSDLWDARTQGDIIGGMALSIGAMRAPGIVAEGASKGYNAAQYYHYKHNTDKSDASASVRMTPEKWEPLRERIDGTTNEEMQDVISDIISTHDMSMEQKQAAMDYVVNLMKMRGYNIRSMAAGNNNEGEGNKDTVREVESEAWQHGYESDAQGRKDIAIALSMEPDNAERKAAWEGVQQRIEDDADAMVAQERESFNLQRNDDDGSVHPATMTIDGQEREVFIKSGLVTTGADGSIDIENSGETIVVYDPVQGKNVMVSPQDLGGVGEVVTAEQYEAGLQAQREAYVQQQQDAATGRFNPQPGQQIEIPEAGTATVLATDGESVTLQMPDGTQQSMAIADIQSIVDAISMEDYRQRHPEAAVPETADVGLPGGLQKGVPAEFEPDMDVFINEDGQDKVLRYIGRARLVDAKGKVYEPDEEGNFLAFYDPTAGGMARYVNTKYKELYDDFLQKVVGYKPAEQEEVEQPAEPAAAVEPEEAPVEEQPGESVQQEEEAAPAGESAEAAAASAAEVNSMPMKTVGTGKNKHEEEDWYATTPERAYTYLYEEAVGMGLPVETADNMVANNLKKAQQAVERAKTATGSVVSVLQKQNAAQAAVEYWEQVQSIRRQDMLAELERRDAEQRAEQERRRAETEAARKAEQEAYEAEVARRRAEQAEARQKALNDMTAMAELISTMPAVEEASTSRVADIQKQKNRQDKIRKAKELYGDYFDDNFEYPRDIMELVSMSLPKDKVSWGDINGKHGLQHELGSNITRGVGRNGDLSGFSGIIAKSGEGISFDSYVKKIYNGEYNFILGESNPRYDELELKDALLDHFMTANSEGDIRNYALNNRIQQAEAMKSEEEAQMAVNNAEEEWMAAHDGLTRAEHDGWIAYFEEQAALLNGQKYEDYYNKIAESTLNNGYDRRTETDIRGSRPASNGALQGQEGVEAVDTGNDAPGVEESGSREEEPAGAAGGAVAAQIEAARAAVDTHPTEGQKKAGNYPKGHLKLDGYDITLENPKGSVRSGVDANGREWSQEMHNDYGYIRGTEGVDGYHIDVFLSDTPEQGDVFVVDQVNSDGSFDEHKVMYGFPDMESAREAYLSNYEEGWQGLGAITPVSKEEFKKWVESSHRKTKPFSEYKSVKTEGDVLVERQPSTADYRQQAEKAIADILDGVERGGRGPVVSDEMTEAIKKIADMEAEAEERLEDNTLSDEERARVQAQYDAASKWMEEHVRSQKGSGDVQKPTKEQKVMVRSLVNLLNEMGVPAHLTVKEGQAALDKYREMAKLLRVWHGSGADFDRFDHSKMGTGEGAQAFGYGTYVTQVEGIGKSYAEKLGDRPVPASYKGMTAREIETKATVDFLHKTKGEPTELSEVKWDALLGIVRSLNNGYGDPKRMIAVKRESIEETIKRAEKRLQKWQDRLQNADGKNRENIENSIRRNQEEIEDLKEALDYVNSLNPDDFKGWSRGGTHVLYEVEIPDDNGSNYIDWNKIISKGVRDAIKNGLEKERYTAGKPEDYEVVDSTIEYKKDGERTILLWDDATFESFMHDNFHSYDSVKEKSLISKILHDAGFTGIKYPAQFMTGGREDGAKNYVIFDENDLKIVDKIRFHKAEDGEYVPEMKPVFYSNAMKAVESVKQEKATAEQWIAMLQKNGGLKAGEDKWIGLSDWLRGLTPNPSPNGEGSAKPRILTKQEVMDYINENAIEVEEVEYGEDAIEALQEEYDKLVEEKGDKGDAWSAMNTRYMDKYDVYLEDYVVNYDGRLKARRGKEYGFAKLGLPKPINGTRLNYTTNGLENKREIALTIQTIEPWNKGDDVHFGDAGEGRAVAWVRFGETYGKSESVKEAKKAVDDYLDKMADKYGVPKNNDLLDRLTKEEKDHWLELSNKQIFASGIRPKVLVIDEIQSKRHQEGREKGYKPKIEFGDVVKSDDGKNWLFFGMTIDGQPRVDKMFVSHDEETVDDAKKRYIKEIAKNAIPDAPFEKNWHELAMKRMLRYAAENDYDKVAWTKGEQQAERYYLSKELDILSIRRNADGTYNVEGRRKGDVSQQLERFESNVPEDKLANIVGKDVAKRAIEYKGIRFELKGEGLRIGGEGMKGFYDQILPRFMDKYGKKWGVKTTDISLPNLGDNGLTMWSVDVTPEMKASVMEGQPMFFKTPEGEVYGFTLGGEIYIDPRYAKPETPVHEYIHLWAQALRDSNPTAWARLKEEMRGVDGGRLWDYVQRRYPELKNEDELEEEVFAHYSGKRGGERLEKDMREEMKKANGIFEKAHVANIFHKLRRLLQRFWKMARDLFAGKVEGVEKLSAEDFADMALGDLMNGFNPSGKRKAESGKRDAEYMAAVERGDMETAQRMVDAEARRKGYVSDEEYRMSHTAPNGRGGFSKSIDDVTGIYPEDLYGPNGYHYYGDGEEWMDRRSAAVFRSVRGNPDAMVKIYRAVPKGLKESKPRNGDWVSINRDYAKEHGERNIDGGYKIIEDEVPAKYVYTDGNSLHEQGYDDGGNYAYQNTKNNRKLLDAVTYDDDGNVIPLSKRFNKRNADIRFHKAGTYTTRDGVQLSMMSLFEEGESGVDGSNGSNGNGESTDITNLRLRKLEPGETCLVERRYEENKQFSFTGSEKIESMDDVAYIFKQLEDAAVENVFLALVKDGKPTIIHIGMGTYAESSLDFRLAFAAYKDIQPDAVYVVHNHPSGALNASRQDRNMLYYAKMYFGNDVVKDGIIIDTVSGKYGVFGFGGESESAMPKGAANEVPVKTYEFSKQVFSPEWKPMEVEKLDDSKSIAEFVSSHRLGKHPKMSFIVVNNQLRVVGNYFLPWTNISEIGDFKAAADEMSNYIHLSGGTKGVLYGNYQYKKNDKRNLQKLAAGMKSVGTPLLDMLHIDVNEGLGYHSAYDSGVMEPEKEYEAPRREAGEDYLSYAKRIVEDRNAYDAIVKAYEAMNSGVAEAQVNDPGVDAILNDGSLGMREKITAAAIKIAEEQKDNIEARNNAVRAIGGNLMEIRKAMNLQKEFDKGTVKRVADLARVLVKGGYLAGATNGEMSRILSIVKNATGKTDISGDIRKMMEIMVDSQLRRAEGLMSELESIKGSKVDAKGVEVQGKLDIAGQQVMKTFKETRGDKDEDLSQAISEAENRMASDDDAVAEEAANVRAGLILSQYYEQNIHESKVEERKLREELDKARHVTDRSLEFEDSLLDAIQQNRVERLEAYNELMGMLAETLQKSVDAAKEFNDAAKKRVREIQHNANSDMAGRPAKEHYKPKWKDKMVNNSFVEFMFSPLATFDQMLRLFGSKSANGEGYLYNRFMRGWVDAREKEIRGVRGKYAVLDEKVKSLFGNEAKNMADLIRLIGKRPKTTVLFKNGGELKEHKLTQGNLMYIYMVNKMLDGRMKLRKMGIDEKAVSEVMRILDPRLLELADWMQEEFLVDSRNEYNETHKRIFGAPMAAIEHYFPLKINPNAREDKAEDLDDFDKNEGISTKTGSIIKRRRNSLALDILNADALNVILDHVAKMEHWNAFAEFNRDLNTLRTYAHFRNQVKNMTTIYGSGDKLWEKFNDLCQMAAGTYRPKRADLDVAATNVAKGVTAAKVSFRIFTALKQFLSMPAYLPDARPDLWAKNLATPWNSWSWAMENLPIFEERWKSRMAGDPRLLKSELDWKGWRNNVVQMANKIGMSPNAFVDALTVSIGAKTIYESRKARYLKEGYSEEQAEKQAKQDAEIAYNQTQQSSEGAFLSTMQVDRSWLSVMFTVFRNSSMAYQRQLHDALRNLKRDLKKGNRAESIEFMAKQMVREGVEEEQAKEAATARYDRQVGKDALRVATFGFIMQFCWNLGAYLPYLLFGDDDDKKSDMWDDIFAKSMFGWAEGLTGGDVFSEAGKMAVKGEGNPEYLKKEMPLTSDAYKVLQEVGQGKYGEVINDMVNLVVQAGIGVNPQSITDAVLAIMDACGNDSELAHEATIAIMRILQVPQSQIKEMYFDEVGLSGEEVSNYTPAQLAERYARYQVKRGRLLAPWTWDDSDVLKKKRDAANKAIKERLDAIGVSKVNKAYEQYEEQYKDYEAKVKEYRASSEYKDATPLEKAQWLTEFYKEDPQGYAVYSSFKNMDAMLDKMVKYYLASNTPQEAQACHKYIKEYKQAMVNVLGAESDEERVAAREKRNDCVKRFYSEVGNMQKTRTKEEKMWKEYQKQTQKTIKDESMADVYLQAK